LEGDAQLTDDLVVVRAASLKLTCEEGKKQTTKNEAEQIYVIKYKRLVYKVGDKVLKCNRSRDTRIGDKTAPRYTGPYTIVAELGRGVYKLIDGDKPIKQAVNSIYLKL